MGCFLLHPNEHSYCHKWDDRAEGKNTADSVCPSRCGVRACVAEKVSYLTKLQVGRKSFCKSEDADDCRKDPYRLHPFTLELQGVAADGEHKGNENAVAYKANAAYRLGESAGNYRAKNDEERINKKSDVNKKHTKSHNALVLLEFQAEYNCKNRLDNNDAPDHCRAVINDKFSHKAVLS